MRSKTYELDYVPRNYALSNSFDAPQINISELPRASNATKDDVPERGKWGRSIQSLLLCISMSVGLGNVWRFPNVAYNNGGGAFLIPYLLLLVVIGRPLYYLELLMGQFSSQGPIKVWRCVPAFKGIGYAQVISVSLVVIFYNYLMALSIFYIFSSFQSCLPWTECNFPNSTYMQNITADIDSNSSQDIMSPAEQFYYFDVLKHQPGVTDFPWDINWKLTLCLLLTWALVYISVVQGTDSLGKMSYFTSVFPYVVLTALLIIACQEEGSFEGIKHFFEPDIEKLKDINVWYRACEQSFFSLAIGYGNIIMIASYNKFTSNVYRDAIIISVLDTFTNILAGCVIFSVLGTLAHKYNKDIRHVVNKKDLGLAFIIYPEALAKIKYVPQLWSVLFFLMLFTLGIGSSMSQIETILTVIKDKFPKLREKKWLLSMGICTLFFSLGVSLTTNRGQIILELLNNFGVGAAVFFYATLEVIGVMWIYGIRNFCKDVEYMLGKAPGIFWKITWGFTAPIALLVIFLYERFAPAEEGADPLPTWALASGWVLAGIAVIQIPIWFGIVVYRDENKGLLAKFLNSLRPNKDWGPSDPVDRAGWKASKKSGSEKAVVSLTSTIPTVYENTTFREDVY